MVPVMVIDDASTKDWKHHRILIVLVSGTIVNLISCTKSSMGDYPTPLAIRPVTGDRRIDALDQLLQTCLLPQAVHQVGGAALALAIDGAQFVAAEAQHLGGPTAGLGLCLRGRCCGSGCEEPGSSGAREPMIQPKGDLI